MQQVVLYQGQEPSRVRGALPTFIGTGSGLSIGALAMVEKFGASEAAASVLLLPGVGLGLALAPLLVRLLDAKRIRLAILAVSALSGLALLVR